ncbi:MAG: MFS transporter, partial [Clostridiales Family XIII bacterium]|nr:MFS transporter [Clostridiales Family XIII bacterium]
MNEEKGKWISLISGCVILLLLGLIYAWSVFRGPLVEIFTEWTRTEISLTFTISIVMFCCGGLISGKLMQYLKVRSVVRISAGFLFIGFCLLSLLLDEKSPDLSRIFLYIFYGVFCGLGVGLSYNSIITGVTRHFPGKTGRISGILLMCFGVGGLILGSFVTFMYKQIGIIPTFAACGILIVIIMAVCSFFLKDPPPSDRSTADASRSDKDEGVDNNNIIATELPDRVNYTLAQTLKTATFWFFCIWLIALGVCGLMIINSAAVIAVTFGAPEIMGLIVSVFNGGGRVVIGFVLDK